MAITHAGRVDACPGILELHPADDGPLARIRVPGGYLPATALEILGPLVTAVAGGWVELTSRGNLGVRAVTDVATLRLGLGRAGLLPAGAEHDRARNIVASPLTGLAGATDARPLVSELDAGLQAAPALAALGGRFLFGLDDGSGLAETPDLGLAATGGDWQLTVDGWLAGPASIGDLLAAAGAFLDLRGDDVGVWRVRELTGGAPSLASRLGRSLGARRCPVRERLPLGAGHAGEARLLVVAGWLQRVSAPQLHALASVLSVGETVRLAPAGRIVVPVDSSAAAGVLAAAGLILDADDPRGQVTACAGLGACARATVDVRGLAARVARAYFGVSGLAVGAAPARGDAVHLVSCERACGTPADARVQVWA